MNIGETVEETEARLIAAYEQRKRDAVRNCSDAEYQVMQRDMLKAARETVIGRAPQQDTSSVLGLSDADYEKRKQDMLRYSRQLLRR